VNIVRDIFAEVEVSEDMDGDLGSFESRHIGPRPKDIEAMLQVLGYKSREDFIAAVVPAQIRCEQDLVIRPFKQPCSEEEALAALRELASQNKLCRSYLGLGYSNCLTPTVILRNILENPGWYTQYTPYQPEISQGRLEALLNFQTMVSDLTALPIANASLLDEGTAAAEALTMSYAAVLKKTKQDRNSFFVSKLCHPQTIAVVETRARAQGINLIVAEHDTFEFTEDVFGALVQYPASTGQIINYQNFIKQAHAVNALVTLATDLLALVVLKAPGELDADIAVGNSQRFGVPLGYGGPHAAFLATQAEFKRLIPGRLVGLSKDSAGKPALRLALQTREQHIRREKATSNICTAQVLLAVIAGMYAVYHGPDGLRRIAQRVNVFARRLASALADSGCQVAEHFFDTIEVRLDPEKQAAVLKRAAERDINLRVAADNAVVVALDETVTPADLNDLVEVFTGASVELAANAEPAASIPAQLVRQSEFLKQTVFQNYHSETEFLRYVRRLEARDLSLGTAMIPLGSCTMKLNATTEMIPITWPEFGALHPFAPKTQAQGYLELFRDLEQALRFRNVRFVFWGGH